MNFEVYNILLTQRNTPLGKALDVENNIQWLMALMYSVPTVAVLLPTAEYLIPSVVISPDTKQLETNVDTNKDAVTMLTDNDMEESYFLAQSKLDKLAVAAYALYLNGRQ